MVQRTRADGKMEKNMEGELVLGLLILGLIMQGMKAITLMVKGMAAERRHGIRGRRLRENLKTINCIKELCSGLMGESTQANFKTVKCMVPEL